MASSDWFVCRSCSLSPRSRRNIEACKTRTHQACSRFNSTDEKTSEEASSISVTCRSRNRATREREALGVRERIDVSCCFRTMLIAITARNRVKRTEEAKKNSESAVVFSGETGGSFFPLAAQRHAERERAKKRQAIAREQNNAQ